MLFFRLVIFLTSVILIKTIGCKDQHCNACDSYVQNNITYQTCTRCQYLWLIRNNSCIKVPSCKAFFCEECDAKEQYCIRCNQYYTVGTYNCQLKPYMIAIISAASSLIVLVISILLVRYYCKRIRIGILNDESNQNLGFNQNNIHMIDSLANLPQADQNIIQNKNKNLKIKKEKKNKGLIHFVYKLQENQSFPCQDACTICLQDRCNVITQCNHHFHFVCISLWVQKQNKCPLCNIRLNQQIKIITCDHCRDQYETYNLHELNDEDANIYKKTLLCPACKESEKSNLMESRDISQAKNEKQSIQ